MSRGEDDSDVVAEQKRKTFHEGKYLARIAKNLGNERFSRYQMRLLDLHAVKGLSYEKIAQKVNKDVEVVRHDLQKIYAIIRKRIQAIYGKKGSFRSNT